MSGTAQGKQILIEMEKLMLFDQSSASKWPRVTIFVEQAGGVDQYQDEAVIVYPNGRTWSIGRSQNAPVAPEVVDALYQCMTAVLVKDPNAPTGYASRDVLRYPFRILDAESVRIYDKWKKALLVLSTVVTETRPRTGDNGKVIHDLLARYLPEDMVKDGAEIVEWARGEIDKQKSVAVDLRAAAA